MRTLIVFVLAVLFVSAVFAQRAVEESDIEAFADILATAEQVESDSEGSSTFCSSTTLNVRSGPCTDKSVVTKVSTGGKVEKVADAGTFCGYSWFKVTANGQTGYVASKFLASCGTPSTPSTPSVPSAPSSGNPGFKYDSASACTSGPSKGGKALLAFLQSRFPGGTSGGIYNCRSVRGGSNLSLHGEGRAVDYMLNANNANQRAVGDAIVAYFTGSGAENAKRMGVQEVIWNRKIWSSGRPSSGNRDYTGTNPHTDHVHIGLNRWGAQNCC